MTNSNNSASSSISFSFVQPVKLDRINYLVWRAQVRASIIANSLEGFINGDSQCPNRLLTEAEGESSSTEARRSNRRETPNFVDWKKTDKLLQSWMLSSMVDNVLIMVVDCDSSREHWKKLAEMFMSQSKACYMPLKMQIQTTKKGALSVGDYFNKMKKIADSLAIDGNPLASTDFITHLLTGLDENYDSLITNILARLEKDNVPVEEVYSLMLSHQSRIEMTKGKMQSEILHDMSANFAQKGKNYNKKKALMEEILVDLIIVRMEHGLIRKSSVRFASFLVMELISAGIGLIKTSFLGKEEVALGLEVALITKTLVLFVLRIAMVEVFLLKVILDLMHNCFKAMLNIRMLVSLHLKAILSI